MAIPKEFTAIVNMHKKYQERTDYKARVDEIKSDPDFIKGYNKGQGQELDDKLKPVGLKERQALKENPLELDNINATKHLAVELRDKLVKNVEGKSMLDLGKRAATIEQLDWYVSLYEPTFTYNAFLNNRSKVLQIAEPEKESPSVGGVLTDDLKDEAKWPLAELQALLGVSEILDLEEEERRTLLKVYRERCKAFVAGKMTMAQKVSDHVKTAVSAANTQEVSPIDYAGLQEALEGDKLAVVRYEELFPQAKLAHADYLPPSCESVTKLQLLAAFSKAKQRPPPASDKYSALFKNAYAGSLKPEGDFPTQQVLVEGLFGLLNMEFLPDRYGYEGKTLSVLLNGAERSLAFGEVQVNTREGVLLETPNHMMSMAVSLVSKSPLRYQYEFFDANQHMSSFAFASQQRELFEKAFEGLCAVKGEQYHIGVDVPFKDYTRVQIKEALQKGTDQLKGTGLIRAKDEELGKYVSSLWERGLSIVARRLYPVCPESPPELPMKIGIVPTALAVANACSAEELNEEAKRAPIDPEEHYGSGRPLTQADLALLSDLLLEEYLPPGALETPTRHLQHKVLKCL